MFERLKIYISLNPHRSCYACVAFIYGAGCRGRDKLLVQAVAASTYLLLAMRP